MEIIVKYDTVTVHINDKDLISWTESVRLFVQALKGVGFYPFDFEYIDGCVTRLDDIDEEAGYEMKEDILD